MADAGPYVGPPSYNIEMNGLRNVTVRYRLCIGKNNTCPKRAATEHGLCQSCNTEILDTNTAKTLLGLTIAKWVGRDNIIYVWFYGDSRPHRVCKIPGCKNVLKFNAICRVHNKELSRNRSKLVHQMSARKVAELAEKLVGMQSKKRCFDVSESPRVKSIEPARPAEFEEVDSWLNL